MVSGYKKKRVVFGFRPSFVPLSLWACQVDGESVGLAAYDKMEASLGILRTSSNLWMPCMPDLARAYFTHTNTHWVAPMALLDVNRGQTILLTPSASSCRETILLDAAHWTMEWPSNIICMAAYLRYDNTARCPG